MCEQFYEYYLPKDIELNIVIIQISIFLKEFSEFEYKTPDFRHPKVRGQDDIEQIQIK